MSIHDLERQSSEFEEDPLTPDTLERLRSCVVGFAGEAVELEWATPEITELHNKRIVISAEDIFYAEASGPFSTAPGRRADAVPRLSVIVEDKRYARGGERLAQTVFAQMAIDRTHR